MQRLQETAAAKVNLSLRVLGRRPDGYHELASLVAFASVADKLALTPGDNLSLTVSGPFASALGSDNLVVRAARMLREWEPGLRLGAFHLRKCLPVAAGIGGGSADAAAALRLLARANPHIDPAAIDDIARRLGADVPVCLASRAAWVTGIGERVRLLASFPGLDVVLVNAGVGLATGEVFARLAAPPAPMRAEPPMPGPFADRARLLQWLAGESNDLEAAAQAVDGSLARVLEVLRSIGACRLARMSGSGGTCFGVFESAAAAAEAAAAIARTHPRWWVVPTRLQ